VLSDKVVLSKYTRRLCKVPSGRFGEKYQKEIRTVVLYRILVLVFFLDRAKASNLLDRFPRLFCKDAEVKSTKDLLLAFCRIALAQEGDFIKHLSRMGLSVSYRQEPIDEIDFRVVNMAIDLQDGVLLARLTEILTEAPTRSLLKKLRLPTVSRLQKLHNVGLVLDTLKKHGVPIRKDILPYQIVDSHRDVVLGLMWSVISSCCLHRLISVERVKEEILRLKLSRGELHLNPWVKAKDAEEETRSLLLTWCDVVCSKYGVSVSNLTTDLADGVVVCLLLNNYMPNLLRLSEIRRTDRTTNFMHPSKQDHGEILQNERRNCELANNKTYLLGGIGRMIPISDSSDVPDPQSMLLCLAYMFSRIMDCSQELKACITIQSFFRDRLRIVQLEKRMEAAKLILCRWRENRLNYFNAQRRLYGDAVGTIEKFLWCKLHRLEELRQRRLEWEQIKRKIISIQSVARGTSARVQFRAMVHQQRVCTSIQCWWRRAMATSHLMALRVQRNAARTIQRAFRGSKANDRTKVSAAILIQSQWRAFWTLVQYKIAIFDIIAGQSCARRYLALKSFRDHLYAIIRIQAFARGFLARLELARRKRWFLVNKSAVAIQSALRRYDCKKKFCIQRKSSVRIQATWRQARAHSAYTGILASTIVIQSNVRGYLDLFSFQKSRNAAIKVQALLRGQLAQSDYGSKASKVLLCQARVRGFLARQQAIERQRAVPVIQSLARMKNAREHFLEIKCAAVLLQCVVRGWLASLMYQRAMQRTILMQSKIRSFVKKVQFQRYQMSAVTIQAEARVWKAKRMHAKLRHDHALLVNATATILQAAYRGYTFRKVLTSTNKLAIQIQKSARGFLARCDFQYEMFQICKAQSIARRWIAGKLAEWRLHSALTLQAAARSLLAKQAVHVKRCEFWRRTIAARKAQRAARIYLARFRAAIQIQKTWRCFKVHIDFFVCVIGIEQLQSFVRRRISALKAKRRLWAVQIVQGFSRLALKKIQAATMIQKHTRGLLERLHREDESDAATRIQTQYRGYVEQTEYLQMVVSARFIQDGFRIWRVQRHCKIIQRSFRSFIFRRHTEISAVRLQRRWRNKKIRQNFLLLRQQVVTLQSFVRAQVVRSMMPREVKKASVRVLKANRQARLDPSQTLGARMAWALAEIDRQPSMGKITRAVMTLEIATRLCKKSCFDLSRADAMKILIKTAQSCNRSLPHIELIQYILKTFVNVARHEELIHAIATEHAGGLYIDLLQTFRDKEEIFQSAVSLLKSSLAHNGGLLKHMQGSGESIKRLKQIKEIKAKKEGAQLMAAPTRLNRTKARANPNKNKNSHRRKSGSVLALESLGEIIWMLEPQKCHGL